MPITNEQKDSPESTALIERVVDQPYRVQLESGRSLPLGLEKKVQSLASQAKLTRLALSPISLGVLIILVVNALLCTVQPFAKIDPLSLPATHTWTWWATQEYMKEKPVPELVLLGSSLLMHPVSRQDADYLGHSIDYVRHHRSLYLADRLQERFHKANITCFNFALPGDLVSDDYMVARALFKGEHKPRYIILGISLRDFIDNVVNCPGTTPPFRYLKRFFDIDDLVNLAMPKFWQQLDYRIGKVFYLWGKKLDLQVLLDQSTKNIGGPIVRVIGVPSLLNTLDYRKHVPSDLHSEVEEGMAMVKPNLPDTFDQNYQDYRRRCATANETMFQIQITFLNKIVDFCRRQNIQLIILNMPLTKENLALMPVGSYERYRTKISQTALEAGCPYVDLNNEKVFAHSDFYDTAHMNSKGGKKLLDIISNLDCLNF